jgi:putative membrane protein
MIVEKRISFRRLFLIIWKRLIGMYVVAAAIVLPIVHYDVGDYTLDMTTPLILGTAISIFLGFRTNSAYERWFMARSRWGRMRAMSRNLSLILARNNEAYINHNTGKASKLAPVVMQRMIRRNIAWLWVLGRQLKGLPPLEGSEKLLSKEDSEEIKDVHNPALKLLFLQSRDFRIAQSEGQFFDGEHFEVIGIQRELVAEQTGCEGLRNTPFPTHYTFFTHVFIWLLVVLLSISLPGLENVSYFAIPAVVLIGWTFFMVEGIGSYMQDPFENNRNIIPMDALARSLEIDLKALALGDDDIPPPIEPIEGALY